jgi:hypothetical protein
MISSSVYYTLVEVRTAADCNIPRTSGYANWVQVVTFTVTYYNLEN